MIVYDKNNHPVITKQNLLAKNAADTETIVFPAAQIYHMQVQITGLFKPGQTPDFTRNGVATGYDGSRISRRSKCFTNNGFDDWNDAINTVWKKHLEIWTVLGSLTITGNTLFLKGCPPKIVAGPCNDKFIFTFM